MGCAASVRTDPPIPYSQVMPVDEAEFGKKKQVGSPKDNVASFGETELATKKQVGSQTHKAEPVTNKKSIDSHKDKHLFSGTCAGETLLKVSASIEGGPTESVCIEPGPSKSVSLKSFYFEPSAQDLSCEHPIAPCAPTHRMHVRRVKQVLRSWRAAPTKLEAEIKERRRRFDQLAMLRDFVDQHQKGEE
eukprot:TRINITY_DN114511_c0_g1_i1.p1 TRINITY_DN114511_c0_g1~~TRINITY_DN114511_c0_g1_i1.p1  ORF type:complete len:190 (-),score=32.65 TRINITY_DN114511_c0_g1_i1:33-602(-)